jgi:hypothetical protein
MDDDMNPTPEAYVAMSIFADEYGAQARGCMGFLKSLAPYQRQRVKELLRDISKAAKSHKIGIDQLGK